MAKKDTLWAVIWIWLKRLQKGSLSHQYKTNSTNGQHQLAFVSPNTLQHLVWYIKRNYTKKIKNKINFNNFNLLLDRRINGRVFFNRTERQIQRDTSIRPNAEKPETVRNRSDCHLALNRHYESQHLRNQRQKLSGKRSKCTPAVEKHTTELTNKCRSGNSNLFALSSLRQLLLWFGIL